jgi:phage-related protein (TIGR01555 family)
MTVLNNIKDILTGKTTEATNASPSFKMPRFNLDGIVNVINGLGVIGRDASTANFFQQENLLDRYAVEAVYTGSGIGRRLVELMPNEALGRGIECDHELYEELERIDAFHKLLELATLARLYGGAVALIVAKDGVADLEKPLNETGLVRIEKLTLFDRHSILMLDEDRDKDPLSETFNEYLYYRLMLTNNQQVKIHHTRLLKLEGDYLPSRIKQTNQGWGASTIQGVYRSFNNYLAMHGFLNKLASGYDLKIFKVESLKEAYALGNEDYIANRLRDIDYSTSMMNSILMDAEKEDFIRSTVPVNGYDSLINKAMELVSAEAGMPMTLLYGRSPEGMNSTGESDLNMWYKSVERYQTLTLQPVLERLIGLLEKQSEWAGERPETFEWEWYGLKPMTDLEKAEERLKLAQGDKIYMDAQAVEPSYLFDLRHNGGFNSNLVYDKEGQDDFISDLTGSMSDDDLPDSTGQQPRTTEDT